MCNSKQKRPEQEAKEGKKESKTGRSLGLIEEKDYQRGLAIQELGLGGLTGQEAPLFYPPP